MNKELEDKWKQSEATGQPIEVGAIVVCDVCNEDYTNRHDEGGFIFGSYAYCPACAKSHLPAIEGYGEANLIRARCPSGVSFCKFVRKYRGPDATISIRTFKP